MYPKMSKKQELDAKRKLIVELEYKKRMQDNLPHLYAHGGKWYKWADEFFNSTNRLNFLCAGNQLSKSSTIIRMNIEKAANKKIWRKYWSTEPNAFAYFYPTRDLATSEFHDKWVREWLPKEEFREHGTYAWKPEFEKKHIKYIHFLTSGVKIYFFSYEQKVTNLQAKTLHQVSTDEECPYGHFHEILFRLSATGGQYFNCFTATLGQEYLRQIVEPETPDENPYPDALIRRVSAWDCQEYTDGSKSHWTDEKIQQVIDNCATPEEVEKRVKGRFVVDSSLKYSSFNQAKNISPYHSLPSNWLTYIGVDIGSGGKNGHPSAIVAVRVDPFYRMGRVVFSWRGDDVETTAGDTLDKLISISHRMQNLIEIRYDWAAKDFETLARRRNIPVIAAQKNREYGTSTINTLFKKNRLSIYTQSESCGDNEKLVTELAYLKETALKRNAKDDLIDALRYAVATVPWSLDEEIDFQEQDQIVNFKSRELVRVGRGVYFRDELDGYNDNELDEFNELAYGFDSDF